MRERQSACLFRPFPFVSAHSAPMRIDSGMGAEVGAGPPQNCSDDLTLERFLHIFDSVVDLQNAVSARPPGL